MNSFFYTFFFCLFLTLTLPLGLLAQEELPTNFKFRIGKTDVTSITLPIVFYEPRTSLGFGIISSAAFRMSGHEHRMSGLTLYSSYTLRSQFLSKVINFLYFGDDRYLLKGDVYYYNFFEDVYGIGGRTIAKQKDEVGYKQVGISESLSKRINKTNFFAGISYLFELYDDIRFVNADVHNTKNNITQDIRHHSLGLNVIYDSRDNPNGAYSGSYFNAEVLKDLEFLGATQDVVNFFLDYRHFFPLSAEDGQIMALRFYLHYVSGSSPYLNLPMVGEHGTGRGFKEGRYRGNFLATMDAEYRFFLFPKASNWLFKGLRMNIFGGMSVLSEGDKNQFLPFTVLPSLGLGFRYVLDTESRIAGRADMGTGLNNNVGFYVNMNEAY